MPTKRSCPITLPCECGLARPRRLFGLSMERVDGAPGSDTVFRDPDPRGLPPTITPGSLRFPTGREIQGPLAGAGPARPAPRRLRALTLAVEDQQHADQGQPHRPNP